MQVAETTPATRTRILEAAVSLFAELGYDATSVSQIINRAGVAKGGFYHHFASKNELLYEVYADLIETQLGGMRRILDAGGEPDDVLRALILDLVETTAANAPRALVFTRELSKLGDERTAQIRRARRSYHEAVAGLVREAQADGRFATVASADTITFTIFGMINELPLWYRAGGRKRPAQIGTELADFVLAALQPR
jgi:AcrR family transcriptional regulator